MIWLFFLVIISQMLCTNLLSISMDLVAPIFDLRVLPIGLVLFLGWILSANQEKELL